jgi:putative transposon-encoded protein
MNQRLRFDVLNRDYYHCKKCDGYGDNVHHIIPRSKGGSDEMNNLMTLCKKCHMKIHGMSTYKIISDTQVECVVKRFGGSGHVMLPKKWLGKTVRATLASVLFILVFTCVTKSYATPYTDYINQNSTAYQQASQCGSDAGKKIASILNDQNIPIPERSIAIHNILDNEFTPCQEKWSKGLNQAAQESMNQTEILPNVSTTEVTP